MINDIVSCIAITLDKEFGCKIFDDSINNNLDPPGFIVMPSTSKRKSYRLNRNNQKNSFIIQYFPDDKTLVYNVLNHMYDVLKVICDKYIATDMEGEVVDDVLTFKVNYNAFWNEVPEIDNAMESYELSEVVKDERSI